MKKGNKVSFIYHIRQDFKDPSYTIFNRPRINNTFFHVLGKNLFMVPCHLPKIRKTGNLNFPLNGWISRQNLGFTIILPPRPGPRISKLRFGMGSTMHCLQEVTTGFTLLKYRTSRFILP